MNFKKIFRREDTSATGGVGQTIISAYNTGSGKPMAIDTVYRCVNVISDSVAALPLNLYQWSGGRKRKIWQGDPVARMLNDEPDERMSRYTLIKAMVSSMLLWGNGYAYIDRSGDTPRIIFLHPGEVAAIKNRNADGREYILYKVLGMPRMLQHDELIHTLNFSYDGLMGVSTLTHAYNALKIAHGGESQAATFYNGGGQPSGLLSVEAGGRIRPEDKQKIYNDWENRLSNNPGGMMVLEGNMKYSPISINPADAQLLESRQFSVIQICRFFGVSPVKCFDLTKSSYSTVEATQLAFLTDTLAPILENIELEIKRKLFIGADKGRYEVKFDTGVLLRADKTAQANYYNKMVMTGIMTPNEVREQLDMDPVAGGDKLYMQTNMSDINNISNNGNQN